MRHASLFALASLCVIVLSSKSGEAQTSPAGEVMLNDVHYLASDALGGRLIGSAGADSAAAYLARRFKRAGLRALPAGWFQEFTVDSSAPGAIHTGLGGARGRNVIGVLPGSDRALKNEVVVVGAHYDHLGPGGFEALDPDSTGRVHNGADDNASGSAALIRIASDLTKRRPARTVVFIAFSGEEEGLLGSAYYVKHPAFPMESTYAMVNLDMVGRLRNERLIIYGTETAREFDALLDSLNTAAGFDLRKQGDGYGPSDQSSFYAERRPVLHFFTDLHEDYHRTTDDWDKINAAGLVKVADFAAGTVRALAERREPLTFVEQPAKPQPGPSATPGYGAYLGTIPDMTGNPGGVRLTGVRPGSPAEQAGLRRDDIITRIGEMEVPDLEAMTVALRSHKAGDVVEIAIRRDGVEVLLTATLGTRGN